MSNRVRCACRRCTIRGLMGPAVIITVGVLFLLDQMSGGNFSFGNTYPMILIVIGIISLGPRQLLLRRVTFPGRCLLRQPMAPPAAPAAPQNQFPGQGQGQ